MDIKEILKLADDLMWAKTGKHLDHLQEAILRGTLEGQTYTKIADETYSSEGHLRDLGSELWKLFSEEFGEEVTKGNFRSLLDKGNFYHVSSAVGKNFVGINNFNICSETTPSPTSTRQAQPISTQVHVDLGDAPEILSFYGREEELAALEQWIVGDRCRLVALLGISGIGKTAIALSLIDRISDRFDYVIYRSLRFSPPVEIAIASLLQIFRQQAETTENKDAIASTDETPLSQLLNYLRQYRCLIVLDDVQALFSSGQLAGQYKSGCENYHHFFKLVAEISHKSSVMAIAGEKPREVAKLEKETTPVRSFVLGSLGVAAKEILKERQLSDEANWDTLIATYQGNPLWLELTSILIRDLFGGSVSEFLQYEPLILSESLQAQLDDHFQRLTQAERAVMVQLADETEPVAIAHLLKTTRLSASEFVNAAQSLRMRLLVDGKESDKVTFLTLNGVLKQHVKNRYF